MQCHEALSLLISNIDLEYFWRNDGTECMLSSRIQ